MVLSNGYTEEKKNKTIIHRNVSMNNVTGVITSIRETNFKLTIAFITGRKQFSYFLLLFLFFFVFQFIIVE